MEKVRKVSLIAVMCLIGGPGCYRQKAESQPSSAARNASDADPSSNPHAVEGHAHGAGPHDGVIADWGGGKYHVELTLDHSTQEATVYVLGGDEQTPSPIQAEEIHLSIIQPAIQVMLKAMPQENDPAGSSSRFVGKHESFGIVQEYAGTITGVIDGTPYSGDFDEAAHGH